MLPLVPFILFLTATRCAVRAAPIQEKDIFDPFDPFKSVASELLGFTTAFPGPLPTGGSNTAIITPSSTKTGQSTAASARTTATGGNTVSGTASQLSTGGVSATSGPVSSATATGGSGGNTSNPTGQSGGTAGSSGASVGVVPTTTGSSRTSSTGTSIGSGSSPVSSGSGPGTNPGSSPGSGSGSGSGSGATSAASTSSNRLSPGEIAAAVILPVLALLALLLLLFRYNKPLREKYSAWNQQRLDRAAYRRALDDPILSFGMRQKRNPGLGVGDVEQLIRPTRPLSFGFSNPSRPFPKQPRKPLNWDASHVGGNTNSAIGMAVPLPAGHHSRSESEISEDSDIYGGDDRPASRYQDARSNQVSPEGPAS